MRHYLALGLVAALNVATAQSTLAQELPEKAVKDPHGYMGDVEANLPKPDAHYRYGDVAEQSAELRLPEGTGPFPVAVLIHGGCWVKELGGTGMQSFAEMLRKRGFATWDVDYRRLGHEGGGWPGSYFDVAAGVDYLSTIAAKHDLDMDRVTIVGHSAGAAFAMWTASRAKLEAPLGATAATPRFRSAFAIDGPVLLSTLVGPDEEGCGRPVIVPFMGGTPAERPDAYRQAEPLSRFPLGIPHFYVLVEVRELLQPYLQQLSDGPDRIETLTPENANHFDIVTMGLPNGEKVADWVRDKAF